MTDAHWLTAADTQAAYAAGRLSPVELVRALLARIDQHDRHLNAFIASVRRAARTGAGGGNEIRQGAHAVRCTGAGSVERHHGHAGWHELSPKLLLEKWHARRNPVSVAAAGASLGKLYLHD